MSDTLLVRLKPFAPRRGCVLQRFTYRGIKFISSRGWYRVQPDVAEYLRAVHQLPADPHSPLAFDVCTDAEAAALEEAERAAEPSPRKATDAIELTEPRTPDDQKKPAKRRRSRKSKKA